jgi:Arc/MetJ-type ribon-helix-helix transcriptional regulator
MTVSVDPELVKFLDECIKRGYFADRSHGVRFALLTLKKMMEKGEIVFKL